MRLMELARRQRLVGVAQQEDMFGSGFTDSSP
jgi:hypothetical protein